MWQSSFWQIAPSIYLIFPTAASWFTERRSEGLRLAGGNAKRTNERVVFHGLFFFFFSSSLSPASNSLACTNLHLLYPLLQIMALRSKPVPLIHIEASRRWIIGIKIVPQTRLGHEPGPLIVLVAAWGVFTEWGVWSSTASWNLAMEHLESAKSGFSHEKQCH